MKNPIFIHVPKNAGTSIRKALDIDHADHGKQTTHVPWCEQPMREWYGGAGNPYLFAVVRHPCSRAVSCHRHFARRMKRANPKNVLLQELCRNVSVNEFWLNVDILELRKHIPHLQTQAHFLQGAPLDRLLRFERLNVEWVEVANTLGRGGLKLPTKNSTSQKSHWREVLSKRAQSRIASLYSDDFEIYDYAL